jgi:hypothetical protein
MGNRSYGRIVRVTTTTELGGKKPEISTYVVAEPDRELAIALVKQVVHANNVVEVIGRASEQLLKTFNLEPGEVKRA